MPPEFCMAIAYAEHWNGAILYTTIDAKAVSKPNIDGSLDRGVMQLNSRVFEHVKWDDPRVNIEAGVQLIKDLSTKCSTWWEVAVAYNCGIGRMRSRQGPPKQSLTYADRVMSIWGELTRLEYLPVLTRR